MTLIADNIGAGYGRSSVLRGVSLEAVGSGGLAVLGPNGAGKTTLLRVLSGLVKPTSGRVELNGTTVTGLAPEDIVRLGIVHVPQGRRIFGSLTVRDNLRLAAYTAGNQRLVKAKVDEMVDLFPRLRTALDRPASRMSGGEQQMLAIARALMIPASVMLLDEPSDGLAPIIVEELAKLLIGIQASMNIPMIIVEQNPWLAAQVAERCIVIVAGQVVASGLTDTVAEPASLAALYLAG